MDFIMQLPKSTGFNVILVMVDRFSKMGHFTSLKSGFTAKDVAKAFTTSMVKLHGYPAAMISDRDPIFKSRFWRNLFEFSETKLHFSTTYHSQSDEKTEVANRTLE
ncbi:hypothetical protein AAHE18_13G130000 [Arachis hypogaea]|nr:Transposon Tf2-9 polyprotein [Arachis hypogaea]